MEKIKLSNHFTLKEFINVDKYPDNLPTPQALFNLKYGCQYLLEPARQVVGPIIINSGFRNARVNALVGGVKNSQHLMGQAADIRPKDTFAPKTLASSLNWWTSSRTWSIPTNY